MKILKIMGIWIFIVGIFISAIALHSVDLAWNFRNSGCVDMNALGYIQDIPTIYINGFFGVTLGIVFMLFSFPLLLMNDNYESKDIKTTFCN